MRNTRTLWDAALVVAGVLCIGFTLHLYQLPYANLSYSPRATLSTAEAERQIESAKAYLASHPEDFNAWSTLAVAYYSKGPDHYIDAMNALDKARDLGATDERLFFYAGVMCDALGLPDYAIKEFSKSLRHNPGDYETMVRLANVYFHEKRYEEALSWYKQVLHEYPNDPTVWFNYAVVCKEKNDLPTALSALDHVQKIAGRLPEGGFYEQGEIYRLQGDDAKAEAAYQQELTRQPDYVPALEAQEALAKKRKDYKQVRELHKRITELKSQQKAAPAS